MNFFKSITQPLVNLAAWVVAREYGEAGADKVKASFEKGITAELRTAVPILIADIEKIEPALAAIADASIEYVREKFVALVSNVDVSSTAAGRITATIAGVAAPVAETAANNLILTFASDVKSALQSL